MIGDVSGRAIERVHADLSALFGNLDRLAPGIPAPRVTIDLPSAEPDPLHVSVWSAPRDFGVTGTLSGCVIEVTYHIWVTLVATGSTAEAAAKVANAYQAVAVQLPLVDNDLGGSVNEVGVPQVKEADAWADSDGRRHAGYLLEYQVSTTVCASEDARRIIKEIEK